jgi:hypothetical protein
MFPAWDHAQHNPSFSATHMNASQPKGWLASVLWNSPGELAHRGYDIKQKNLNEVYVFMCVE